MRDVYATIGWASGPAVFTTGRDAARLTIGNELHVLDDVDPQYGLYLIEMTDEQIADCQARRNGWIDTPPGEWADVHGERAAWRNYGNNLWVGVTDADLELDG